MENIELYLSLLQWGVFFSICIIKFINRIKKGNKKNFILHISKFWFNNCAFVWDLICFSKSIFFQR